MKNDSIKYDEEHLSKTIINLNNNFQKQFKELENENHGDALFMARFFTYLECFLQYYKYLGKYTKAIFIPQYFLVLFLAESRIHELESPRISTQIFPCSKENSNMYLSR